MSETDVDHLPETAGRAVCVRDTFAVDIDAMTPAFSQRTPHVPAIDRGYRFDPGTTMAILSGFAGNRRVDHPGPPRHRQVDAYRAGGGAAELAAACASTSTATSAAST